MAPRTRYLDVTHHIDVDLEPDEDTKNKLDEIIFRLGRLEVAVRRSTRTTQQGDQAIMADLSGLQAEVQQNTDATASITALVEGLAQQLRDAATDPAAIQALADQLDANTSLLAASVAANTPEGEEVPAGEVPPGETPIEDQPHPDNTLPGDLPQG